MYKPDKESSHREIVLFIRSLPRYEVSALSVFLNKNFDTDIPSYSPKAEMVEYMKEVEKEPLLVGLDFICPDECEDDEEDEDNADDEADEEEEEEEDDDDDED